MKVYTTPPSVPTERRRSTSKVSASSAFSAKTAASTGPDSPKTMAITDIGALLVLQGDANPQDQQHQEREAEQRAHALLNELEALRVALLRGDVSRSQLVRMNALMARKDLFVSPKLQKILEEIELRAAVELAKLERDEQSLLSHT